MRVIAVSLFVLLIFVTPAAAQDNTPTPGPTFTPWPTLAPLTPTATSEYAGFRTTPTPWSITPDANLVADFRPAETGAIVADTIINAYKALNFGGVMDFVSFIGMVFIVIALLIRIQNRNTRNHD